MRLPRLLTALVLVAGTPAALHAQDLSTGGYILAEMEGGTITVAEMQGAANVEYRQPITPQTVFHIASLSKQITAAALAHAILDGRVSLDDPVARWIPEVAHFGDSLTVAHLVYMTSGIPEYTGQPREDGEPWVTFHHFTINDAIAASLSASELEFEPGTQWAYSNINYMLITRIVARAYNRPFADVVAERVFQPLGMTHSLINDDATQIIPNRADGYTARTDAVVEELRERGNVPVRSGDAAIQIRRTSPHYGGSGVMTSMEDWALWLNEMHTHSVFGDDFWALMTQTHHFGHDKVNDAFGLYHTQAGDHPALAYAGSDIDANSYAVLLTDTGLGIACFANDPFERCEQRVHDYLNAGSE